MSYLEITKKQVNFCALDSKSLKHVVTQKKEKKKDQAFIRMAKEELSSVNLFLSGQEEPIMDIASKRSPKEKTSKKFF